MTANISFYPIVILALHGKSHSLQERKCECVAAQFKSTFCNSCYTVEPLLYGHPLYTDSFICPDKKLIKLIIIIFYFL